MLAWRVIDSEWDSSDTARIWRAVFILTAQPQIGKDPSWDELLMLSCPGLRLWFWCSGQGKCGGKTTCMSSRAQKGTIYSLGILNQPLNAPEELRQIFPLLDIFRFGASLSPGDSHPNTCQLIIKKY